MHCTARASRALGAKIRPKDVCSVGCWRRGRQLTRAHEQYLEPTERMTYAKHAWQPGGGASSSHLFERQHLSAPASIATIIASKKPTPGSFSSPPHMHFQQSPPLPRWTASQSVEKM